MKHWQTVISLIALAWSAGTARADTAGAMAAVAAKASGAIVMLRYEIEGDQTRATVSGQAICIDARGVFMTLSIDQRLHMQLLKNFRVVIPGVESKTLQARFLGLDPLTGLGFVQTTEPQNFSTIRFARSSNLSTGKRVISVGLALRDPAFPTSVGTGFVSSILHVPQRLVYLTGGTLGGPGSVVFDTDGLAIGMVTPQPFSSYQMQAFSERGASRVTAVALKSEQRSLYFTPVEEFVGVLENIPSDGKVRRVSWIGIRRFEAIQPETAKLIHLTRPGVMIDQVIAGQPAAQAGLKDRDVIIAMNGKDLRKMATGELVAMDFRRNLMATPVNQPIKLTVLRGRETLNVELTTRPMPVQPGEATRLAIAALGLIVRQKVEMDRHLDSGPNAEREGVIVMDIRAGSPAGKAGLRTGDLIIAANGQGTTTVAAMKEIIDAALAKRPVQALSVQVLRGNQLQTLTIHPPL